MPDKVDLLYALDLPPEQAMAYFKAKGYAYSWDWFEVWQDAHAQVFTVAKAMRADILQDIRDMVDKAISEGITFQQFKKELEPKLRAKGWWGKYETMDPTTGELYQAQLGSPYRLRTIYRVNTQTAYMAGRYKEQMDLVQSRPYWQYVAVLDRRTRPAHAALDGRVLRAADPFWNSHYPPNGWLCRCRVRALSQANVDRRGLTVEDSAGKLSDRQVPVSQRSDRTATVTDFKTRDAAGRPITVTPDPGWNHSPGRAWNPEPRRYDPDLLKKYREPAGFDAGRLKPVPDSQKGSNPGGIYEDPHGKRYYVKFYGEEKQARAEKAATEIYRMMGLDAPKLELAQMADPSGKKRLALISEWMDDLQRMSPAQLAKHPEELGRIFHASALVKNWDVVGLDYDNIMRTAGGRLVVVDSGGSFTFRARGASKAYDVVPTEVKTLLDPLVNKQAAEVFGKAFGQDVWLEAEAAKPLLKMKKTAILDVFEKTGFSKTESKALTDTLWKRRAWLIERYDLDGGATYKGFGKHLKEFRKWGVSAVADGELAPNGAVFSRAMKADVPDLVRKFERYVEKKIHKDATRAFKGIFLDWSGSSSSSGGAVMKKWAERRFGAQIAYHVQDLADGIKATTAKFGMTEDTLFALLDAEYEFHQYYLRRLHRWDEIVVERGMAEAEFKKSYKKGLFSPNAVASTTTRPGVFSSTGRRVRVKARAEDFLKTWYQGKDYMSYYTSEVEYVMIGRPRQAEVVK